MPPPAWVAATGWGWLGGTGDGPAMWNRHAHRPANALRGAGGSVGAGGGTVRHAPVRVAVRSLLGTRDGAGRAAVVVWGGLVTL